jgi:hypothetical protein
LWLVPKAVPLDDIYSSGSVTPAEAGVQVFKRLDSRFHGNDS